VRYLLPVLIVALASCVSSPCSRTTTVVSVPAGATCTTADGEVYTLPAEIRSAAGGTLRLEVELEGHEPRLVELQSGVQRPRMASFLMLDLVGGLVGAEFNRVEPVEVIEGQALLELQPLQPDDSPDDSPTPGK
jgi:hypothetical protein